MIYALDALLRDLTEHICSRLSCIWPRTLLDASLAQNSTNLATTPPHSNTLCAAGKLLLASCLCTEAQLSQAEVQPLGLDAVTWSWQLFSASPRLQTLTPTQEPYTPAAASSPRGLTTPRGTPMMPSSTEPSYTGAYDMVGANLDVVQLQWHPMGEH